MVSFLTGHQKNNYSSLTDSTSPTVLIQYGYDSAQVSPPGRFSAKRYQVVKTMTHRFGYQTNFLLTFKTGLYCEILAIKANK
jgi:hypothetical protein